MDSQPSGEAAIQSSQILSDKRAASAPGFTAWQLLASFLETLGSSILVFFAALLVLMSLLFFLRLPASGFVMIAAAGLTGLYGFLSINAFFQARAKAHLRPGRWLIFSAYLVTLCLLFITSLTISGSFFDLSYDGQWYHASAVMEIARGWNPIQSPALEQVVGSIPIGYYPKASWINSAALYMLTGHIEQAKAVNILLLIACWSLSLAAFLKFSTLKPGFAIGLSLAASLNPIILSQSMSFYNDGQIGSLYTCMVALIFILELSEHARQPNVLHDRRFSLLAFGCAFLLIVNLKFTGAVYGVILAAGLWLWQALTNKYKIKEVSKFLIASLLVAILVAGYNPYLTNTIRQKWASALQATVTEINTPENLRGMDYLSKQFYALFSETSNSTLPARLQAPFLVSREELSAYSFADLRIGGFGPFFGEALFAALILGIFLFGYWRRRRTNPVLQKSDFYWKLLIYTISLVILTVLVNPEAWWARYAPQTWLIPVLVVLCGLSLAMESQLLRVLSLVLFGFILLNSVLVGVRYIGSQIAGSRELHRTLSELSSQQDSYLVDFGHGIINQARFDEYGIMYTRFKSPNCPQPLFISGMDTMVCPDG